LATAQAECEEALTTRRQWCYQQHCRWIGFSWCKTKLLCFIWDAASLYGRWYSVRIR